MTHYEGPTYYKEQDFYGCLKHEVLDGEVDALFHNMEAAGIDNKRLLTAIQQRIEENQKLSRTFQFPVNETSLGTDRLQQIADNSNRHRFSGYGKK
ncbi:hypothetical protein KC976_03175 [Candidatus Saccharibacteria bacterium]|nr:hypothetical protein [Candidatus Saccharibacteria bacterium]